MRRSRLERLASACRVFTLSLLTVFSLANAASAATLSGSVTDPNGRGVARARIVVTTTIGAVASAVTDDRGTYQIANLPAGSYDVSVIADGFQADPARVQLSAEDRRELTLSLRVTAVSESIVVTAAQTDMPLTRTAAAVSVISEADLRAGQITTVPDALRTLPGLTVVASGSRGAVTSVFPRGGGSNYTLVLVDGMRVNSFGGGYDFAHLATTAVERIEVARGGQSAMFGSDAAGGVVQVVTKRDGPPRAGGLIEGGSQGTFRATADTAGSNGAWNWGGGVERADSDGYTGTAPNGETVSNDDDMLARVTGSLGWRRPGGADVLVSANYAHDERGYPGPFGSDPAGFFSGVDRVSRGTNDAGQIGGRVLHGWTRNIRQRIEANFFDLSSEFASQFGPSTSGSRRFDVRVQEDIAVNGAVGASAGVEFVNERGNSTYVTGTSGEEVPVERGNFGAFVEGRFARQERLFLTAGLRFDHLSRKALEADPFAFQPRPSFPEQGVNSVNPRVAVSYLLTSPADANAATKLRVSAGTGIRPPSVFEIAFTDNPDLQPERSRNFDIGVEQSLAAGMLNIGATGFFNRYDDLIVTVGRTLGGASRYRSDNISNARARGLELSGNARAPMGLSFHVAYTFLDTEILEVDRLSAVPPPFKVGDPLIRRPRHQTVFHAGYDRRRLTGFAEVLQRSETLDLEPNFAGSTYPNSGYAVFNAGASVALTAHFQLFVRGLNLTDREYEEVLGYPALRRSGIVGVRVAASR
jgi:outer membrane cobalamin receptor